MKAPGHLKQLMLNSHSHRPEAPQATVLLGFSKTALSVQSLARSPICKSKPIQTDLVDLNFLQLKVCEKRHFLQNIFIYLRDSPTASTKTCHPQRLGEPMRTLCEDQDAARTALECLSLLPLEDFLIRPGAHLPTIHLSPRFDKVSLFCLKLIGTFRNSQVSVTN